MYFRAVGEVHDKVHGGTSDAKVCKAVSQLRGAGDGHNDGSDPAHGRASNLPQPGHFLLAPVPLLSAGD